MLALASAIATAVRAIGKTSNGQDKGGRYMHNEKAYENFYERRVYSLSHNFSYVVISTILINNYYQKNWIYTYVTVYKKDCDTKMFCLRR